MNFDVQLIEYEGNDAWVPQALLDLKACLSSDTCPEHAAEGFGPKAISNVSMRPYLTE